MTGKRDREEERCDVVVIGGGPAGSTAATLLARQGRRVILLDRERFPRFRIGESLMPATYWSLERLGLLERLRQSFFPKKFSVQFFSKSGKAGQPFYFSETEQHESSQTWQVDRPLFDSLLLDNAREAGADVRERTNVKDVIFEGATAVGVRGVDPEGRRFTIAARVVVDASGQTALLSRRLGLKVVDPKLRHSAYYARFRGAPRAEGRDEGATLILHTEKGRSWFWFIPLPDDLVSVGVVGPIDYFSGERGGDPQTVFDEELEICPALQERLRGAEQVTPAGVLRDFSYTSRRIAGDGWILAGDAFGFLDPIYSSGVFLALKSGEFAADAIDEAFRRDDFSGAQLGRYGEEYLRGMEALRKLVYAYYDPNFSIGQFIQHHPDCREELVHLLIGNVYRKPPQKLFERMAPMCELPPERRLETAEGRPMGSPS